MTPLESYTTMWSSFRTPSLPVLRTRTCFVQLLTRSAEGDKITGTRTHLGGKYGGRWEHVWQRVGGVLDLVNVKEAGVLHAQTARHPATLVRRAGEQENAERARMPDLDAEALVLSPNVAVH